MTLQFFFRKTLGHDVKTESGGQLSWPSAWPLSLSPGSYTTSDLVSPKCSLVTVPLLSCKNQRPTLSPTLSHLKSSSLGSDACLLPVLYRKRPWSWNAAHLLGTSLRGCHGDGDWQLDSEGARYMHSSSPLNSCPRQTQASAGAFIHQTSLSARSDTESTEPMRNGPAPGDSEVTTEAGMWAGGT